jgi:hypothetical protein
VNFLEDFVTMNTLFKRLLAVVAVLMLISLPAYAQYTVFTVDASGAPLTYPTLASAIATANSWPLGPHKIMIKAGTYHDADLNPVNVDEIYGDPAAAPGDIKFVSPAGVHNFITAGLNLKLKNMKLDKYAGSAVIVSAAGVSIEGVIIHGASGIGIDLSGSTGAIVNGVSFTKLATGIIGTGFAGASVKNCQFDTCNAALDFTGGTGGIFDNIGIQNGAWGVILRSGSDGNEVKNTTIANMSQVGVILFDADGNYIHDNLVYKCTSYAVSLDATSGSGGANWVRPNNCLVHNRAAGTSQGFDDNPANPNSWYQNFYSDQAFTMNGAAGATDVTPKTYMVTATAGAASYNLNDEFVVDFNYAMPGCAALDSVLTAAYQFSVYFDPLKLQLVDKAYDMAPGLLGPSDPALYTAIDVSTPGTIVFAAANFTTPGVNGARMAWAKFKVIAANTGATISEVANYFRDPNNNSLPVGSTPLALTLVDNVKPIMVSRTANEPAGDNVYSDGSIAGPGPFYKLFLTMHATDNYALAKFQWNSDGGTWNDWIPATGTDYTSAATQFDFVWLGLGEGFHTAGMRVVDAGGNISDPLYYDYVIDRTAPVMTSFVISAKNCSLAPTRWTNNQLVSVAIAATGAPFKMELSESGPKPLVAFAANSDFTLGAAEVSHTVYVQLYDKYNNSFSWVGSNAITLDKTAPVVVGPLVINGGALKTNNKNVTLTLTSWGFGYNFGKWNATQTEANLTSCTDAGWKVNDVPSYPHAFALSSPPDGNKTVYFATMDSAGNISNHISASIVLDTKGPDLSSFSIVALTGKPCANALNPAFTATYGWSEADVVELQYSYDDVTWGTWKSLVAVTSPDNTTGGFTAPGDGVKRVYARLKDDVGNFGPSMHADLEVDMTAPTIGTEVCADKGNTYTPDPTYPTPGVTNSANFWIKLTGLSTDITKIEVSQDGGTTWGGSWTASGAATYDVDYTWVGTPPACSWVPVKVRVSDCAGNQTVSSANVYFDLVGPSITFTGPALTNTLGVTLAITSTDACAGTAYVMRLKDGSAPTSAWETFLPSKPFTLNPGDGDHTVYLQVADYGGNVASATCVIKVDMTKPTAGTFTIVSGNPLASPGFTNSLAGNKATIVPAEADVAMMWIQNSDGTNPTGPIAVASPYNLANLSPAGAGIKKVFYWFQDLAGNWSDQFEAQIDYNPAAPPAPGGFSSTPGGSCLLKWTAVPNTKKYIIRFNFQNQYPTYQDPNPPYPANMTEGILATDTVTGSQYHFVGPQPDKYAFSLWTLSKYGVLSGAHSTAIGTNYILGDYNPTPNGCIQFGAEFGELAMAYNSVFGDPNFNQYLDIAPTNDMSAHGYPIPDKAVNFEDLVIFALNYDDHHALPDGSCPAPTATNEQQESATSKPVATALDVTAVVPSRLRAGDECVVPIKISDFESVKGYHVVLDFDRTAFELVRVEQGTGYQSVAESFFYVNKKTSKIDVSGVVLGKDVQFTSDELFRVVLKAKHASDANVEGVELTFRDRENRNIAASLSVSRTVVLPTEFALSQNYPNPFNPTTTIEFSLPTASEYKLSIFNVLGQVVKTFEGRSEAGYLSFDWDASMQSSGVYLYRLEAGSFEATRKMVLLK